MNPSPWLTAVVLALLSLSCQSDTSFRSYCSRDEECPPGTRCDPGSGLCLCASDLVCPPGWFCAPDGQCKKRMACDNNLDCPVDMLCDTNTGNCTERKSCTGDLQCRLGEICEQQRFTCVAGCRTHADCPLGQVCDEQNTCREGQCIDKSYCRPGELCDPINHTCVTDTRGPFCAYCSSTNIYEPHSCGSGPNFCLVKGGDLSLPPYCGVDCSQGQDCPNGYDCFSVRIVYTSENCTQDSECVSGRCQIREGDQKGFCLCSEDDQCPQDTCNETTLECRIRRTFCSPGGTDCARKVHCIDGYCHIGYNCKPVEGLRCEDIFP